MINNNNNVGTSKIVHCAATEKMKIQKSEELVSVDLFIPQAGPAGSIRIQSQSVMGVIRTP